ncbi:transmembrane protein 53 isoform X1 [Dermacentor albipictus]|uniref:transmembrane protein 53 isoform X1 n=1 Tax=Dermacentor albipictus TaxID=60249 RepID=UPI0038FC868F
MMALRGLRVVARIVGAPGKQTGLGSACKVLVPCLSLQSMSMAVRTETLNQNMQLRLSDKPPPTAGAPLVGGGGGGQGVVCPVLTSSSSARPDEVMGHRGVSSSSSNSALRENPLTVLLAWMNARDKHLQNYHDFYLQLGFDVLTVRTLPLQLAFPTSGAQVVAKWLLDFLVNHPNYSRLVVHGFSVGGYQFGEVLVKIRKAGGDYNGVLPRFKAQVYDSLVDYEGIPKGFPTALTRNPVVCKVLELMIHLQRLVLYPLSTVHWKASSRAFHENPLTCPALMINSKRDQVASIEDNLRVANQWRQRGTDVTFCTFDDSKHVQHMGLYPDLYCGEVLRLLRKAQLIA